MVEQVEMLAGRPDMKPPPCSVPAPELVERVAERIFDVSCAEAEDYTPWRMASQATQHVYREMAHAAIAAMGDPVAEIEAKWGRK